MCKIGTPFHASNTFFVNAFCKNLSIALIGAFTHSYAIALQDLHTEIVNNPVARGQWYLLESIFRIVLHY